jgi:hypothetical protein
MTNRTPARPLDTLISARQDVKLAKEESKALENLAALRLGERNSDLR